MELSLNKSLDRGPNTNLYESRIAWGEQVQGGGQNIFIKLEKIKASWKKTFLFISEAKVTLTTKNKIRQTQS